MKILITDHGFASIERERAIIETAGLKLNVAQCKTGDDVIAAAGEYEGLLVQWAPITSKVIESLPNCKVIVRYGIGVDNIDLNAAKAAGIAVCNIPDYCIDEVADHTMSLALAVGRQLTEIQARTLNGTWKITPNRPMLAFREMTYGTAGFGRIARSVLARAKAFGFRLAAYDPFVSAEAFEAAGVEQLSITQLLEQADILSLHLPLLESTHHFINDQTLEIMKRQAILVNTARGALIDTVALAGALTRQQIGGAGLDVYEAEPLPNNHPLRRCPNAILTSHVAWYSEASVPRLQILAAEEVVRGVRGEALKNRVNP